MKKSLYLINNIFKILEARSHPELNPKINRIGALKQYYEEDIQEQYDYLYFISFTDINKIGVNPRNQYGTPMGIYTYPLKLIYKQLIDDKIPFASNRPYIQVVKNTSYKILNFDQYFESAKEDDIETLDNLYSKQLDIAHKESLYDGSNWKEYLENMVEYNIESIKKEGVNLNNKTYPSFYFWLYTKNVAELINRKKNYISLWNSILRNLGYEVIIDTGHGIIHPNEPCQTLFLLKTAFEHVDTIMNKTYSGNR